MAEHPRTPDPGHDPVAHWTELLEQLRTYGEAVLEGVPDEDPFVRAEGVRYLLRFLAAGISVCVEHDDTETPEFGRMTENRVSWGLDNPDCLYSYTRVRGDATYRIRGTRGSAAHLEFQVNNGHFADGDFTGWRAISALSGDDLITDDAGGFEIWLGRRPAWNTPAHRANWMALDDDASFLLCRQYFGDWPNEAPADLVIDNLDVALPPAPLSAPVLRSHLELLLQWLDIGARCWRDFSRGIIANEPGDVTPFLPPASASGLKGQAYGMGPFRCGPDEAVILTLDPPTARLWGLSLCDRFWQSIDFAARQSSLNSHQARLDDQGRFLGVISHDDPGVANWLDPGDHTEGTLAVRYLFVDQDPPDVLPPVHYRTVARADLEAELPADLLRFSPGERDIILRRRRAAVTRRYRR